MAKIVLLKYNREIDFFTLVVRYYYDNKTIHA